MRSSLMFLSLGLVALLWGVSFLLLLDPSLAFSLFAVSPLFGLDGVTLDLIRWLALWVSPLVLIATIVTAVAVAGGALTRSARIWDRPLWVWITGASIIATLAVLWLR